LKEIKICLTAAPLPAVDLPDLLGAAGLALVVNHVLLFLGGSSCGGGGCGACGGCGGRGRGCGGGGGGGGFRGSSGCACGSTRQAHQAASQNGQKEQRKVVLHVGHW